MKPFTTIRIWQRRFEAHITKVRLYLSMLDLALKSHKIMILHYLEILVTKVRLRLVIYLGSNSLNFWSQKWDFCLSYIFILFFQDFGKLSNFHMHSVKLLCLILWSHLGLKRSDRPKIIICKYQTESRLGEFANSNFASADSKKPFGHNFTNFATFVLYDTNSDAL